VEDLRAENAKLLDEIEQINRNHALQVRQLCEDYEAELEKRTQLIKSLERRLIRPSETPIVANVDKERIIHSQEARIDLLTERCQFELMERSKLLDKMANTLGLLEKAILENDRLRNRGYADEGRIGGRYESPFRPEQARRLHLPNTVFGTPETPKRPREVATPRSHVQIEESTYHGRLRSEPVTPE
jgi:hypothetical protein